MYKKCKTEKLEKMRERKWWWEHQTRKKWRRRVIFVRAPAVPFLVFFCPLFSFLVFFSFFLFLFFSFFFPFFFFFFFFCFFFFVSFVFSFWVVLLGIVFFFGGLFILFVWSCRFSLSCLVGCFPSRPLVVVRFPCLLLGWCCMVSSSCCLPSHPFGWAALSPLFCKAVLLGFLLPSEWCCCFPSPFAWCCLVSSLFGCVAVFSFPFGGVVSLHLLWGVALSPVFCWMALLGLLRPCGWCCCFSVSGDQAANAAQKGGEGRQHQPTEDIGKSSSTQRRRRKTTPPNRRRKNNNTTQKGGENQVQGGEGKREVDSFLSFSPSFLLLFSFSLSTNDSRK